MNSKEPIILTISSNYISISNPNKKNKTSGGNSRTKKNPEDGRGKKKSSTTGFSESSRRSLIKALNSFIPEPLIFVTLVYPPESLPSSGKKLKENLDLLAGHIRKDFPKGWFLWRLKFREKDAAPYFNLLGTTRTEISANDFATWIMNKQKTISKAKLDRIDFSAKAINAENLKQTQLHFSKMEPNDPTIISKWKDAKRRWGYIARKNMNEKLDEYKIDEPTLNTIRAIMIDDLKEEIKSLQTKYDSDSIDEKQALQILSAIDSKKELIRTLQRRDDLFFIQYLPECIQRVEALLQSQKVN